MAVDISNLKPHIYRTLDVILSSLIARDSINNSEFLELCSRNNSDAEISINILEEKGLIKKSFNTDNTVNGFFSFREKIASFLKSGNFSQKYFPGLAKIKANELIGRYNNSILYSECFTEAEGDKELINLIESVLTKKSYELITSENGKPLVFTRSSVSSSIVSPNTGKESSPNLSNPSSHPVEDINPPSEPQTVTDSSLSNKYKFTSYYSSVQDANLEPCFNTDIISRVFANHINSLANESGQMLGIFGPWGRGKTYFARQLYALFSSKSFSRKYNFITFHAWKYQDTPAIWAYLFEELAEQYYGKKFFPRFLRRVWLNIKRERWSVLRDIGFFALLWGAVVGAFNFISVSSLGFVSDFINVLTNNNLVSVIGGTAITSLLKFYKNDGTKARDLLKKYSKGISFSNYLGA
jgi:hypothetical protein